jgi:hypothetical protein
LLIFPVFQPHLDILGMVIYATEFVLWCGVFACGGYFNLLPWVQQKLSVRSERKLEATRREYVGAGTGEVVEGGMSNAVQLERTPSSTSVFRTPSGGVNGRMSMRSRNSS